MRTMLAIARKELNIYLTTPLAYIVLSATAFVSAFFFVGHVRRFLEYTSVSAQPQWADYAARLNLTDGVVLPLIFSSALVTILVAPLLTMRLIAEERREGTFELLMTYPVRTVEIVLGKYLGGLAILALCIALTLLFPAALELFAGSTSASGLGLEWRTVLLGYAGFFLLGAAFMAIGLCISSFTDSQLVAAIITLFALLLLWMLQSVSMGTEGLIRAALIGFSAPHHLMGFLRGALELKDLLYFLSWIALGLYITCRSVEAKRWA